MTENVGDGFMQLTKKLTNLVSLQLTFRKIAHQALIEIGQNCPYIEIIKLIGYKITSSESLKSHPTYFKKLKVLEIRVVRSDGQFEDFIDNLDDNLPDEDEDDPNNPGDNSITPQLMKFFLTNCLNIQDVTIFAMLNFLDEEFLMKIFKENPMNELQRLCICPLNKNNLLTVGVASNVIMSLPNLHTIATSRWKMKSREVIHLIKQLKNQNFDINFV